MSGPVAWGIGMMIAGEVVEQQDWFGDKFGEALKIGGAIVALNPGGVFGGQAAATQAGVSGAASEMGAAGVEAAGAGAELAMGDAALAEGAKSIGSDMALSQGVETAAANALPAASWTPGLSEAEMSGIEGLLADTATVAPEAAWYEGQGGMMAAMTGGQAVSGMAQAKALEEQEKRRIEEEKRKDAMRTYWGRNKGGDLSVDLNVGEGLTAVNSRFFNNRNSNVNRGLLE